MSLIPLRLNYLKNIFSDKCVSNNSRFCLVHYPDLCIPYIYINLFWSQYRVILDQINYLLIDEQSTKIDTFISHNDDFSDEFVHFVTTEPMLFRYSSCAVGKRLAIFLPDFWLGNICALQYHFILHKKLELVFPSNPSHITSFFNHSLHKTRNLNTAGREQSYFFTSPWKQLRFSIF